MARNSCERLYLDANATYGLLPEVRKILRECLDETSESTYLNGSAIHLEGQGIRAIIDRVRRGVYETTELSESNYHMVFTSGATEGNNTALLAPFLSETTPVFSGEVLSSSVEHPSVEESLQRLSRYGVSVCRVRPDRNDEITVDAVLTQMSSKTKLLSLIWANNETGVIHPVPEIFAAVRKQFPKCILHVDAVQMFSKMPTALQSFPFDFLTIAPHKFGALPGIGISLIAKQIPHAPLLVGGSQELKWRPGTESLLGILSIEAAMRALPTLLTQYAEMTIRDQFEELLISGLSNSEIIGKKAPRLPNTTLLRIPGISTEDLVVGLDLAGVACSRGSACSSGKQIGSHILAGMEYPHEAAREVLRFSFRADFEENSLKILVSRIFDCFIQFGISTNSTLPDILSAS